MPDLTFIIFLFVLVIALNLFLTLTKPKKFKPPQTKPSNTTVHQSYNSVCIFANRSEMAFFHALQTKLPPHYHMLTKVRLEDIVNVDKAIKDRKVSYGLRGRIKSRHVDFCVIDDDGIPHMVIELDGKSHASKSAKNADELKNGIFTACKVPFIRVKTGENFHTRAQEVVMMLSAQKQVSLNTL